jgi:hypothetical protein
MTKNYRLKFS